MNKENQTAWERWELASFDLHTARATTAPEQSPPPLPKLPTAEEIEEIYRQAHEEGYQAGFREGNDAGRQAGETSTLAIAANLTSVMEKLESAIAGMDEMLAPHVLALAIDLARKILCTQVNSQPEHILAVVMEALKLLPHHHAMIYLNPEDAALVRSLQGDTLAHAGHRLHEDPLLTRGDCLLDAGNSHIDATLATRWRRVLATLGSEAPIKIDEE